MCCGLVMRVKMGKFEDKFSRHLVKKLLCFGVYYSVKRFFQKGLGFKEVDRKGE